MCLCLGTSQERRADRDCTGAKCQRGRYAAAVADATCRDDRNTDMIRETRDEREQPDGLALGGTLLERPSMPAGFESLREDRIGACGFRLLRFGECGRGREPRDAARF